MIKTLHLFLSLISASSTTSAHQTEHVFEIMERADISVLLAMPLNNFNYGNI